MSAVSGDPLFDSAVTLGLISPEIAENFIEEAKHGRLSAADLLLRSGLLTAEARHQLKNAGFDPRCPENGQDNRKPPSGQAGNLGGKAAEDTLPRRLGRYQLIAFLGRGGMGKVYKAYDPKLKRHVALKLLYRDDPLLIKRFTREARAQASIDHERVCRVFEVDEADGIPYIAMQFLDGAPLDRLKEHLPIRRKVAIFRQVVEGVQAAHDVGLIHRDLKPSNILVSLDSRGVFQAHVVDFGLARGGQDCGLTQDGALVGTPAFMAPEQIDPSLGTIDRRTDIYALGVSFYQWLTQRLPFEAEHSAGLFEKIRTAEPVPPRKWHGGVPRDLETIVMKCLEKAPSRRYPSAKALGEDLKRFLQGDPIQARPKRLLYVLGKRIRKYPFRFAGVLVLLAALAWAGHSAWSASVRERFAQDFTAMVKDIEAEIRFIHLSRRHDIQPEIQRLKTRMNRIAANLEEGGALAIGPGNYALGRGYLALGQETLAKDHLETAWESGFRQPQVAFYLSKAYQNLYREALWPAELIAEEQARQRRIETIRQTFREPAKRFMTLSDGMQPDGEVYLEALLAFYESDLNAALALMDAAPRPLPWQHEGLLLKGDIYRARAIQRDRRGEKSEALDDLTAALDHYNRAANIAASDPAVYRAIGEIHRSKAQVAFFESGDLASVFREGQAAVDLAISVQSSDPKTLVLAAKLANLWAEYRLARTIDPTAQLDQAIEMASAYLAQPNHGTDIYETLGRAHWNRGRWHHEKGQDPSKALTRALNAFEKVPDAVRFPSYYNKLGSTHLLMARYRESVGEPSSLALSEAVGAYGKAIELAPNNANGYTNMGICLFKQATQEATPDSQASQLLARAIHAIEQAQNIQGDQLLFRYYLGRSHLALAQHSRDLTERFQHFDHAEHQFERGLVFNSSLANLHSCLGETYHLSARQAWVADADPEPYFRAAIEAYKHAVNLSPEYSYSYQNLGLAYLDRARMLRHSGQNPDHAYREAISWSKRALKARNNRESQACLAQAGIELAIHRRGPESPIGAQVAPEGFDELLERHPNFGQTWSTQGLWHLRSAMATGDDAMRNRKIHQAVEAFQCAAILDSASPETRLLMASWLLETILQNGPGHARNAMGFSLVREWIDHGQFDPILGDYFHALHFAYALAERPKNEHTRDARLNATKVLAENPQLSAPLRKLLNPDRTPTRQD